METIENLMQAEGIRHVDLPKIDTEARELSVVDGARAALEPGRIDAMKLAIDALNVVGRVFTADLRGRFGNGNSHRLLPNGLAPWALSNEPPGRCSEVRIS